MKLYLTEDAEDDVGEILGFTLNEWGRGQYWAYSDMLAEAYAEILADPKVGRIRLAGRPQVCGHHIRKPGRDARHIVFYDTDRCGDIRVLRVLHDMMDFSAHL